MAELKIIVDASVNKGKPSVPTEVGTFETVKGICAFINGGVSVEETVEELHVTKEAIALAIAYATKYPEVIQ